VKFALSTQGRTRAGRTQVRQVLGVFLTTFALATAVSLFSDSVLRSTTILLAVVVLALIIVAGIAADMVGLATATASRESLSAMAAKKVPGARHALRLTRMAPRVATICNDLIGDLCGTVSGAAGAAIVFRAGLEYATAPRPGDTPGSLSAVLVVALVAALTVGGKASGKNVAIGRADQIVLAVGRLLWWMEEKLGLVLVRDVGARRNARRSTRS